jgi:geranylgeranyl diphosphate synthase type II
MVGGQVDDLAWEQAAAKGDFGEPDAPHSNGPVADCVRELEDLHSRKTGALIRAALRLGVFVACAPQPAAAELLTRFDGYGRALGLAFQITDDLLDVEGHVGQAGKRVGKDAARGKLTYPGLLGTVESRERAERLCQEAQSCLSPLGENAAPLHALADFVLKRDR